MDDEIPLFFDSDEEADYERTGISKHSVQFVHGELDLAAMADTSNPMDRRLVDEALANADFQKHEFAIRPLKENAFHVPVGDDIIPNTDIESMNQDLQMTLFKE